MPRKKPDAATAGAEVQAPAVRTEKLPAFVTVACKIHTPAFVLELCREATVVEEGLQGKREVKVWHKTGRKHVVAGMAYPVNMVPAGYPPRPKIVNGYALTHNIPGDFWREWLKQHGRAPYVVSGMIKAYAEIQDVRASTDDHKADMSGMEPIQRKVVDGKDTIADPRVGRSANASIQGVMAGDKTAA